MPYPHLKLEQRSIEQQNWCTYPIERCSHQKRTCITRLQEQKVEHNWRHRQVNAATCWTYYGNILAWRAIEWFIHALSSAFLSSGGGFTVGGLLNASRETTGRPGSHSLTTELAEFPFKGLGTQSLSNAQTGYRSPVQMGEEMPVLPPFCQPNSSNAL